MNYLTQIGKDMLGTHYWFTECDVLSDAAKIELAIKINWVYNQVNRLDTRIDEMIQAIPEWNQMKWDNIIRQRDARQAEFEQLLKAYERKPCIEYQRNTDTTKTLLITQA